MYKGLRFAQKIWVLLVHDIDQRQHSARLDNEWVWRESENAPRTHACPGHTNVTISGLDVARQPTLHNGLEGIAGYVERAVGKQSTWKRPSTRSDEVKCCEGPQCRHSGNRSSIHPSIHHTST